MADLDPPQCSCIMAEDTLRSILAKSFPRTIEMGSTLYPTKKDTFPIPHKTKKSLKRQMSRWLRRRAKTHPEQGLRTRRHRGWYW